MFEQEWSALFRVAAVTKLVDAVGLEQRVGGRTVRVVAIDATHLAFQQRHVRALVELSALCLVAGKTSLADGFPRRQSVGRKIRHRIVAVAAGQIVILVDRAVPENALAALMTRDALRVLLRNRRLALARKTYDGRQIGWVLDMHRTRTVTGFAPLRLVFIPRIEREHCGVHGMSPV